MVRTLHHPPHDISVTVGLAAILGLLFALASGIGQIDNTPERATLGARGSSSPALDSSCRPFRGW